MYSSGTSSGKGSHSVLHSHDESGGGVVLQAEDQAFVIRRKGKGGRNRPNMEKMAVRHTQDAMDLKNQISAFWLRQQRLLEWRAAFSLWGTRSHLAQLPLAVYSGIGIRSFAC